MMTDPSAASGSLLGKGLVFRFLFLPLTHHSLLTCCLKAPFRVPCASWKCWPCLPAAPLSHFSWAPLMSQRHHGNVSWCSPHPNAVTVNERSGSWQLPSLRDRICEPELLMMERKRVYVGKEAGGPWVVVQRCHGDTWLGRRPLDEAAASSHGQASAPL